ncbi:hypothetical protein [Gorillibacterium timonense]|uniref:hypothetical protein n=1 Tax=Gorillibacterium timonense TaxID=1689269 RepID=UPI0011DDABFB|nr:hypothetical protein [Gorillibacterium timonense]
MRKRIFQIVLLLSMLSLFLNACSNHSHSNGSISQATFINQQLRVDGIRQPVYEIPLTFNEDYIGVLALLNRKFIYYNLVGDVYTLSSFDMTTGKSQWIGKIEPFFVSNDSSALLGDHLFFYVGTGTPDRQDTNLYDLNLKTLKLKKVLTEKLDQTLVYMKDLGDRAISYKGTLLNHVSTTFVDSYKPGAKKAKKLVSFQFDHTAKQGEFIYNIAAADKTFYVVLEKGIEQKRNYVLSQYDINGVLLNQYHMDQFSELFGDLGISTVKIMGNYVYATNFSSRSIIGKIVGDEIIPVVKCASGLELATDSVNDPTDYYLFEQRNTERFFLLDVHKGEWLEVPIPLDPVYKRFGYTVTDGQQHALIMMNDDSIHFKLFYLNVLDFLPQAKPVPLSLDRPIEIPSI